MKLRLNNHSVEITHPEKVLFPKSGITKQEIVDYYLTIAPHMLPYMKNRPLTMLRFPNGINHEGFFQKDASDFFPSWITRCPVKKKDGGITHYVVCDNQATLIYLANLACLTPHLWLSTVNNLTRPDRMIFDLDPSTKDFSLVVEVALRIKKILEHLKLHSFVTTTGSRGLHVVVPIKETLPYNKVRAFAAHIGHILINDDPKNITMDIRKEKRDKKVFIDTLRNGFGATAVAPYAVRAHEDAPVATPLYWEELSNKKLRSTTYTIKNVFDKLKRDGNPWKNFSSSQASLN